MMSSPAADGLGEILASEDVRQLVDLGFVALSAGLLGEAEAIFTGVLAARPDGEAGALGMAMVQLARNDVDGAVSTLRSLPPTDAAMTYLGIALLRRGDVAEGRSLLEDVRDTAIGTPFAALAEQALDAA